MARSILKEKAETQKKKKKIKKLDYSPVYVRGENRHEFTAAVNPADGGISREFADLAVFVKCSVVRPSFLPSFNTSPLKRRWSEPKVTRRVLTRGTFLEPADCLSITPEPGGAFYPGRRALGPATDTPPSLLPSRTDARKKRKEKKTSMAPHYQWEPITAQVARSPALLLFLLLVVLHHHHYYPQQ